MFETILVPLDGSQLGELALPYAEELAGLFNSRVEIMHVCDVAETQYRHMHALYTEKIAQEVRGHIKAYRTGGKSYSGRVTPVVLDGDSAAEIIDYAEKHDISLIVIVSHGRFGVMPWTMGSTAIRVVQRTSKPVLLVRADISGTKMDKGERFNKILVPLDGSENGEAALPYVREIVTAQKSEVTLLQVVEPGRHVHTVGGLDYVLFPEEEVEKLRLGAMKYLEGAGNKLEDTQATMGYEVRIGHPAQEIVKFGKEAEPHLVAISTHGRSGVQRWISGSVAYKVVQAGSAPVLLVRSQGAKSS